MRGRDYNLTCQKEEKVQCVALVVAISKHTMLQENSATFLEDQRHLFQLTHVFRSICLAWTSHSPCKPRMPWPPPQISASWLFEVVHMLEDVERAYQDLGVQRNDRAFAKYPGGPGFPSWPVKKKNKVREHATECASLVDEPLRSNLRNLTGKYSRNEIFKSRQTISSKGFRIRGYSVVKENCKMYFF